MVFCCRGRTRAATCPSSASVHTRARVPARVRVGANQNVSPLLPNGGPSHSDAWGCAVHRTLRTLCAHFSGESPPHSSLPCLAVQLCVIHSLCGCNTKTVAVQPRQRPRPARHRCAHPAQAWRFSGGIQVVCDGHFRYARCSLTPPPLARPQPREGADGALSVAAARSTEFVGALPSLLPADHHAPKWNRNSNCASRPKLP